MQNAGISSVLATNAKYFLPNNELKEGQIVVGKVNELNGDGTARIIINGKIITATVVEEALSKGKFYFEVKDFKDGKVELKVIGEIKQNDQRNTAQILKELDIPLTKESDSIIKLFLQSERPITKAEVLEALNQLIKSTNKQQVLDSISFLIKKDYPITKELVQTLIDGTGQDLSKLLSSIDELPFDHLSNSTINKLKSMVEMMKNSNKVSEFQNEQFKLASQMMTVDEDENLLNSWSKQFAVNETNGSKVLKQEIFQNLVKLAENSPTVAKAFLSSIGEQPEFAAIKSELARIPLNLANEVFTRNASSLIESNVQSANSLFSNGIMELKNRMSSFVASQSSSDAQSQEVIQTIISNVLTSIHKDNGLNQMTKVFLQNQLLNGVDPQSNDPVNDLFTLLNKFESQKNELHSETISKQIRNHNDLVGLNTESKIRDLSIFNKSVISEQFPTLKEIALKALNSNLPDGFKQPIEQLITKITAGQITAVHQNGPEYHLSTVIPIFINNWSTDLTIQWTGKESTSNPKEIQSNYCHILFFLELETLKETMVDVSIQNRVVNVTIFNNEERLNSLIATTLPLLKESLARHEFHLTGLKCLPFKSEQEQKVKELKFNSSLLSNREYTGVDVFV